MSEAAAESAASPGRTGRWRSITATVLIVIAAILAPVTILATWAHDEISDTNRYVDTVGPLVEEPAVQQALATRITNEILTRVDVVALTEQAVDALEARGLGPVLAARLDALAVPLESGVQSFVYDRVLAFVSTDTFATAWEEANRVAHEQMVAVLEGTDTDTIDVSDGAVKVSLATLIETVKANLVDRGFTVVEKLPPVNAEFVLFQSADLKKAQDGFSLLDTVARWLPFVVVALIALAVYLGRSRRRTLVGAGLGIAVSMLALGLALNLLRSVYLDALPEESSRQAGEDVYDALVNFIRLSLRAVLVVALALAIGAWISGPSNSATSTRRGIQRFVATLRGGAENAGLDTGATGAFVHRNRNLLRGIVIGVAGLVYIQAAHPTGAWTLWIVGFTVLALLILEFLAKPAASEHPPPTTTTSG